MKRSTKRMSNKKKEKPTAIGQALRALGGLGGGMVGGYLGNSSLGKAAGTGLGAVVSRWLGQGDYTVTLNSLVNRFRTSGDIPNMHKNGQSVVVRHKEFLYDVQSSTGFTVGLTLPLNPGLESSFPWLSNIAQQYQEYTWKGVIFEFVSTSGDVVASSNTALGSVMMATQYKSTSAAFVNKQQMLNEYFASDAKPSECFCHPIECNPAENPYNIQYVRGGAVPSGEDAKTYDLGTFYLATTGMQASAVTIGELWVSYEVELRKPVLTGALELDQPIAIYYNNTLGTVASTPFGTTSDIQNFGDTIGLTMTGTTIQWPIGALGTFFLSLNYGGTVTVSNMANWISSGTLVNCTASLGHTAGLGASSNWTGDGTGSSGQFCYITITNPAKVASFAPSVTTLTGATTVTLRIFQVPTTTDATGAPY